MPRPPCPAPEPMAPSPCATPAADGNAMNLSLTLQTIARVHARPHRRSPGRGHAQLCRLRGRRWQRIAGALRHAPRPARPAIASALAWRTAWNSCPLLYGIWRAGLAAVPMNSKLHAKEMAWILANAGAKLCLVTPEAGGALSAAGTGRAAAADRRHRHGRPRALLAATRWSMRPADPDAEAWLFYTSGTTGRPKGADADPPQPAVRHATCYYADIDHIDAARHDPARRAAVPRLGPLRPRPHRHAAPTTSSCRARSSRSAMFAALRALPATSSMFAAPTMVSRLINHPARRRRRHARPEDHHLRRRADVSSPISSARSSCSAPSSTSSTARARAR